MTHVHSPHSQDHRAALFSMTGAPKLMRQRHLTFLRRGLEGVSSGYSGLDAARPWICYWILHALDLLDSVPDDVGSRVVDWLSRCRNSDGGYGGGPGHFSHLAPTYAAVLSLLIIGTDEAIASIDRAGLYNFYMGVKDARTGGFHMHKDGEVDVRGTYTAIAIADLVNVLTPELRAGVAGFAARCQTLEGGFGGEPGNEAHGGYAFCGLAAVSILDELHRIDLDAFARWLADRQMRVEGGYQGRTNKLVDACYSFWQGGSTALLADALGGRAAIPLFKPAKGSAAAGSAAGPEETLVAGAGAGTGAGSGAGASTGASSGVGAGTGASAAAGGADASDGGMAADGAAAAAITAAAARGGVSIEVIDDDGSALPVDTADDADTVPPLRDDAMLDSARLQRYTLLCSQQKEGGLRDKPGKPRDYYHTCYSLSGLSIAQHCFSEPGRVFVYGDASNLVARTSPRHNIRVERVARARAEYGDLVCEDARLRALYSASVAGDGASDA